MTDETVKKELQQYLKQLIENIEYKGQKLIDSVVVDYQDKFSGLSTAVVAISKLKITFGYRRATTIKGPCLILVVFKTENNPLAREFHDVAGEFIVKALREDPVFSGDSGRVKLTDNVEINYEVLGEKEAPSDTGFQRTWFQTMITFDFDGVWKL